MTESSDSLNFPEGYHTNKKTFGDFIEIGISDDNGKPIIIRVRKDCVPTTISKTRIEYK